MSWIFVFLSRRFSHALGIGKDKSMCFGIPYKIKRIKNNKAAVYRGGKIFNIDVSLLPKIKKDDWVLTQGDIGFKKISGQEADEMLSLLNPQRKSSEGKGGSGR